MTRYDTLVRKFFSQFAASHFFCTKMNDIISKDEEKLYYFSSHSYEFLKNITVFKKMKRYSCDSNGVL